MKEYRSWFKAISTSIEDAVEEVLLSTFMIGLKKEIRTEVKLFCSTTLKEARLRAQEIEEKNWVINA